MVGKKPILWLLVSPRHNIIVFFLFSLLSKRVNVSLPDKTFCLVITEPQPELAYSMSIFSMSFLRAMFFLHDPASDLPENILYWYVDSDGCHVLFFFFFNPT